MKIKLASYIVFLLVAPSSLLESEPHYQRKMTRSRITGIKKFVVVLLYYPKQYFKKLIAFLIFIVKGYSL